MKEHIVIETGKLFSKYGCKSVTMDDIAKHLGMSKRTIYQHFADKDELVSVLVDKKLTSYSDEIIAYEDEGADAIEEVFLGVVHIDECLDTLNAKLFHELQKYHHHAWLKFKNFKEDRWSAGIVKNIKRGIREGLYRSDINIDILTELRIDQGTSVFNQTERYKLSKYTVREVMIEITTHFLQGICSTKGKRLIEHYRMQLVDK
ncbi:MAG: TetR/AcrR family transcriptional regulator [Bacteroidia bacterium]